MASKHLGTTTISRTPPLEERAAAGRSVRYKRQNMVRDLLPGSRVAGCNRLFSPRSNTVSVMYSPEVERAHYKGLMICGNVWICPVCAAKISERRRVELAEALARNKGQYSMTMLTFTFQHSRGDRLADLLAHLGDSIQRVRRGAPWKRILSRYGVVGSISGLEVTYGQDNGWHPHKHVLFVTDRELVAGEVEAFRGAVSARFERMLAKNGRYASSIYGVQATSGSDGLSSYLGKWGAVEELTKSAVKAGRGGYSPFELVDLYGQGESWAAVAFLEYAKAIKGKRQLVWSRGLRQLLGGDPELTDKELAELEEEPAVVLAVLTWDQWLMVLRNRSRALLLEVASSGRRDLVAAYLGAIGVSGFG